MKPRILAVSSGGGHWEQLMIISASFAGHDVFYANTIDGLAEASGVRAHSILRDCNRNQPLAILAAMLEAIALVRAIRPDFVISTGAAPGLLVLLAGKLLGTRTIWIDSVANADHPSLSGRLATHFADLHLTQWQHLADNGRPAYWGSVL